MAKIDQFFQAMLDRGASDLHLTAGASPLIRQSGEMVKLTEKKLSSGQIKEILFEIISESKQTKFKKTRDLDFAYQFGEYRFRANFFFQRKGMGAVFRVIPTKILTVEDLGLPKQVLKLSDFKKGLVLVTGGTGSGKSTTLAALIDHINKNRKEHILTVEDPIEFVHENQKSLINQREVGSHTASFATALRAALREDPDIILVGEMRDLETIELAITAAETGHLVFGTLHTSSAPKTIDRIINVFPTDQQEQIRMMLSESLRGVVSQNLLKTADGKGRVAALEILFATSASNNLIRENKTFQLYSIIQTGKRDGMQTMDQAIMEHFMAKRITAEEAYAFAVDKKQFEPHLQKE
jgi:twitching motility protein PilT